MVYYSNKESGEHTISIGSQAWNMADGYVKIKILRLVIQLDIDEEIALFGRKDDIELIDPRDIASRRVESFEKYIFHLKQLIGNCQFAIEKGADEHVIKHLLERIKNVEEVMDGISDYVVNDVTKETELRVNETHMRKCVYILQDVKNTLNFPINRAGLIFKQSDEMDIEEIMNDVIEGG